MKLNGENEWKEELVNKRVENWRRKKKREERRKKKKTEMKTEHTY